jgi:CRP/FNR family transcriptional regulator
MTLALESTMAFADRGDYIFMTGGEPEFFCISGQGFVKMAKSSKTGQEIVLEILGPGQAFGMLVVLEKRPFPLSAIAVTPTWYLKVPRSVFQPIYDSNAALRDGILLGLAPRLQKAHDMLLRFSSSRIDERIAVVLFILADSYGEESDDGILIKVPLTRQDISELAGTTIETTIRVLSKWQKQGIIGTEKKFITLKNEDALQQIIE